MLSLLVWVTDVNFMYFRAPRSERSQSLLLDDSIASASTPHDYDDLIQLNCCNFLPHTDIVLLEPQVYKALCT